MQTTQLVHGVSAAAMLLALAPVEAKAQTQLPGIDIGRNRATKQTGKSTVASKAKPTRQASHPSAGRRGGSSGSVAGAGSGLGAGGGAGAGGAGAGSGSGTGAGYGGAGVQQDPYNKTYTYENATTATKTDTPVMETPANVQSVTQQVIKDQQVTSLSQALQFVSGVTTASGPTSNGNPYAQIVVRGFAANYIYRDGFRLDLGNAAATGAGFVIGASGATQFANVQSLDVLKGAAAVLYGLSEPGGLVNIVTKQPLDQPFYEVNQQVGSLAEYRTTVDATGPLTSDKAWLYRINMSYENNGAPFGSFIDNTRAENIFVAPVLKWNLDNDTWVKLEGQYLKNTLGTTFSTDPEFNGAFINVPRSLNYGAYSPNQNENVFAALSWEHKFDKDWSIKQLIAFNRYETDTTIRFGTFMDNFSFPFPAYSGSPFTSPVYDRYLGSNTYSTQTLATEVDITGHINTWGAEHTLLFGGDFYSTMNWNHNLASPINSPQSVLFPVNPGLPVLGPLIPQNENTTPQDSGGLYAQDQIKLPYDLLLMTAVRYQYFRQGGGFTGAPSFATNLDVNSLYEPYGHASVEQHVTPRYALLWRPLPWVSGFVSYTEGFSQNTGIVYPNIPAPPTGARDAEAGLKFEFFDGKVHATLDYYNLTKTNVTYADLNPFHICGPTPPSCVIVVGEARSKGPELDVQGEIYPGLRLILNYTNQSVEVTKTYIGDMSNLLGQPIAGIPRNIATLSGTYELQDGVLKGLKLGATYRYNGAARVTDGTGDNLGYLTPSLAGYGIVDVLAAYPFYYEGWKFDTGVNIHNLFDRTYYTGAYYVAPLVGLGGSYGGRTYGDQFSVLGHLTAQWPGLPPAPSKTPAPAMSWVHDWTGPYAGLQVGMGVGDNGGTFSYVTPDAFFGTPSFNTNGYGVLAGAHLGYNKQFDQWVVGLEALADVTDVNKSEQLGWTNPAYSGGSIDANIASYFQGSLRARAGYAWNRLLVYGTGGLAFGAFNVLSSAGGQDQFGNFYYAAANERSMLKLGWTGGAGVEYAITPHWSARAEYRYSDFGHITETPTSFSATVGGPLYYQGDRHVTQQQVQLGASYKFGGVEPEFFPIVAPLIRGPAFAGDLPSLKGGVVPAPVGAPLQANWTGLYVGGQAGYGWGDNHGAYNFGTPDFVSSGALAHDAQGVIFGAHLGYNHQFDNYVVGVEGSVDGTTLIRREQIGASDAIGDQAALSSMVQSDIQGAVRARAGYAFGRLLPFVAGGLAIGHFGTQSDFAGGNSANFAYDGFATHGLQYTTRLGWTVGGGLEWAVNNHWSIRGEYRYSDFGRIADTPTVALPSTYYGGARHLDQNQVQVGFSYKFGDPLLVAASAAPTIAPPAAPPIDWTAYNWTGVYAGAQLGMVWSPNHGAYDLATPGGLAAHDSLDSSSQVAIVGGHLGYNRQFDHWVLGLEGSVDGTNIVRTSQLPVFDPTGLTPGGTLSTSLQSNIQGSIRGRAGYAFGRLLPYVTGGVAVGDFSLQSSFSGGDALGPFNAANGGQSFLRVGWTLGAGVEYALTRNLAVRGEYRYTDFGNVADASTLVGSPGTYFSGARRLDQNQLQFGFSYKFGEEGPAPLAAGPVVLADLPHLKGAVVYAPPPPLWSGIYAGANLGGAWDAKGGYSGTSAYYDPSLTFGATAAGAPNLFYLPSGDNSGSAGVVGGAQFGYNLQLKSIVIGGEADIHATSVSSGGAQNVAAYPSPLTPGGSLAQVAPLASSQASLPYVGTLRGRAGYLVSPTLLAYGTAGFAYGGVNAWGIANTRTGWSAGAGVEWMFVPDWSAKVEYLYADLSGGGVSGGYSWNYDANFHPQINMLRAGVNYHFNWLAPAAIVTKY